MKHVKVNMVCEAASTRGQRGMEKEVGEGRLLRHLSLQSESFSADKSVFYEWQLVVQGDVQ